MNTRGHQLYVLTLLKRESAEVGACGVGAMGCGLPCTCRECERIYLNCRVKFNINRCVVLGGNNTHFSTIVIVGKHDDSRLSVIVEIVEYVMFAKGSGGEYRGGIEGGCIVIVSI